MPKCSHGGACPLIRRAFQKACPKFQKLPAKNWKGVSYGYDRVRGQKVQTINEAEAENVRIIFDMYVKQNMSFAGIAKSLNLCEIPTKNNFFWNPATVRNVLRNCNYVGNVRYSVHEPNRNFETEGLHNPVLLHPRYNSKNLKRIVNRHRLVQQLELISLFFLTDYTFSLPKGYFYNGQIKLFKHLLKRYVL